MNEKKGQLLSALIGLARASENNEYKLTEDTNRIVIDSLVTLAEEDINTRVLEYLLLNIKKEKKCGSVVNFFETLTETCCIIK